MRSRARGGCVEAPLGAVLVAARLDKVHIPSQPATWASSGNLAIERDPVGLSWELAWVGAPAAKQLAAVLRARASQPGSVLHALHRPKSPDASGSRARVSEPRLGHERPALFALKVVAVVVVVVVGDPARCVADGHVPVLAVLSEMVMRCAQHIGGRDHEANAVVAGGGRASVVAARTCPTSKEVELSDLAVSNTLAVPTLDESAALVCVGREAHCG